MDGIAKTAVVAVVGAGAMGRGIAQVAAMAGHPVLLFDMVDGAAEIARNEILVSLEALEKKGRLSFEQRSQAVDGLRVVKELDDLHEAGLVIEAIVEKLEVKQALFDALEKRLSADAIFATNTSSLSVTAIASKLRDPSRVAGFHFFNPAPVMKLVEVVAGLQSRPAILDWLAAMARDWGKIAVQVRSAPGFIVNRVARPYYGEALRLYEEGVADIATLDLIYTKCGGFRMGPFALMDMIGHDVNFAVTTSVYEALFRDPRYRPALAQQELVEAGWLGKKSGRGFYVHPAPEDNVPPVCLAVQPKPSRIIIQGISLVLSQIAALCRAKGVEFTQRDGPPHLLVDGVHLAPTDGRSATQWVEDGARENLVLFDQCLDLAGAELIVLAAADQASEDASLRAAALFQALGKSVVVIEDRPGMIVMRTLALLIDEANDAVEKGIASAQDVEKAMTTGVNYPRGLLQWGDSIGPKVLVQALDYLRIATGDGRYRVSDRLRRRAITGMSLTL